MLFGPYRITHVVPCLVDSEMIRVEEIETTRLKILKGVGLNE